MLYYEPARELHIALGSVALGAFWITAILRKGTRKHRLLGRVYMAAILGVMTTALPLAMHAFELGNRALGTFLGYLVLITGTAVWTAWRAVRRRMAVKAYVGGAYRLVAWLNLVAGMSIFAVGTLSAAPLLMGMSAVGLVVGYQMLRFAGRLPEDRQWWVKRHYIGIVGSGIATHIAFLNLGLSHLIPAAYAEPVTYVSWFGPVVAGLLAILHLNRRYQPSPGAARTSSG